MRKFVPPLRYNPQASRKHTPAMGNGRNAIVMHFCNFRRTEHALFEHDNPAVGSYNDAPT